MNIPDIDQLRGSDIAEISRVIGIFGEEKASSHKIIWEIATKLHEYLTVQSRLAQQGQAGIVEFDNCSRIIRQLGAANFWNHVNIVGYFTLFGMRYHEDLISEVGLAYNFSPVDYSIHSMIMGIMPHKMRLEHEISGSDRDFSISYQYLRMIDSDITIGIERRVDCSLALFAIEFDSLLDTERYPISHAARIALSNSEIWAAAENKIPEVMHYFLAAPRAFVYNVIKKNNDRIGFNSYRNSDFYSSPNSIFDTLGDDIRGGHKDNFDPFGSSGRKTN